MRFLKSIVSSVAEKQKLLVEKCLKTYSDVFGVLTCFMAFSDGGHIVVREK